MKEMYDHINDNKRMKDEYDKQNQNLLMYDPINDNKRIKAMHDEQCQNLINDFASSFRFK